MKIRETLQSDTPEWSRMRTLLWPDTDDNHLSEIADFFAGTSHDIAQTYVDYQGQGLGKKLIQRAEKWAKDRGFAELASDAETHNARSIAIHEHLGFQETYRVVCFLKKLD